MKIPNKNKEKKEKIKKKQKIKPKKEQVVVVAQEIKFARLLCGNEKKSRDKVLKSLKKWLLNYFEKNYEFKEDDFVRLWKGLFYAVWMSDKPLIQEELCETISSVLDLFPPEQLKHALLMYKAGLRVLATEWYGVDHHRMDKFLMLVRRYLRASLRCLHRSNWTLSSCQLYANMISGTDGIFALKTPRYARNATSMALHILDCYLEEIAKVSSGSVPRGSLAELLRPVCAYMCGGEAPALCVAARRALTALVRQSEQGIKYQHATSAWQRMGCPKGGPEALELVMDDEDDDDERNGDQLSDEDDSSEKPLDPRAGRVDVELPLLPVPADLLADMLRGMLANATSKAHKRVRICLQRFEQLARDEYPLPIKTHSEEETPTPAVKPKKVAQSLHVLEKKLVTASDELALRGLSRKHRKRLLAKSRAGMSIVDDVDKVLQKISNATAGAWHVEPTEPEPKKSKLDTPEKENKKRKDDAKDATLHKKRKSDRVNGEHTDKRLKVESKKVVDSSKNNKNKVNTDSCTFSKITKNKENGIIKDTVNKNNVETSKDNDKKVQKTKLLAIDGKIKVPDSPKVEREKMKNKESDKKVQKAPKLIAIDGTIKHTDSTETPKKQRIAPKKSENVNLSPKLLVGKVKHFKKQTMKTTSPNQSLDTPKKVKFVLKNNSMQAPIDYYKSIRQSPNIPYDSTKKPSKTNLKPSTPSPINPFFKKKLKLKK